MTALEEAVARGARVDAEVRRTFEGLAPEQQTFWLKALLPKSLPLAAALAGAFAASVDAGLEVTRLSEELAKLTATTTANVGSRLAALDQQLDGLRRERDALASRLAHFDAEPPALEALPHQVCCAWPGAQTPRPSSWAPSESSKNWINFGSLLPRQTHQPQAVPPPPDQQHRLVWLSVAVEVGGHVEAVLPRRVAGRPHLRP